MKKSNPVLILASFLIIVFILLTSVDVFCFNRSFYANEYKKLHTAEEIGMTQSDLDKTTTVLLDYIQDKRDDLRIEVEINGEKREVFNERETLHMVDVKNLYLNAMKVRMISGVSALVLMIGYYVLSKKKKISTFDKSYNVACLLGLGIIAAISLYAIADFNSFWINFHYVFFDNDLFFLNPATDILIMMVPSQFFSDLVMRIIIGFIGGVVAVKIVSYVLWRKVND